MNGGKSGNEKRKTLRLNFQYEASVQLLASFCMNHYFHRLLISS